MRAHNMPLKELGFAGVQDQVKYSRQPAEPSNSRSGLARKISVKSDGGMSSGPALCQLVRTTVQHCIVTVMEAADTEDTRR